MLEELLDGLVARGMAETETDCGRSIDRGNNEIHGDFVIRVVDIGRRSRRRFRGLKTLELIRSPEDNMRSSGEIEIPRGHNFHEFDASRCELSSISPSMPTAASKKLWVGCLSAV